MFNQNQVASIIGNNVAARNTTASIPSNYSAAQTGKLIETEPFGDELNPKAYKQIWDSTYDKLPYTQVHLPLNAATNVGGGQINLVWSFQSAAYSPINMVTQQITITFQGWQFIEGGSAQRISAGQFYSFYEHYANEGYKMSSASDILSTGLVTQNKSYFWNCPQTGLFPLITTYELKTGIEPVQVSYMTQDRNLLFTAGAFLLRKIEHDFKIIVPWLELWTMTDNISVAKVDVSQGWSFFTKFASVQYFRSFFNAGAPTFNTLSTPSWTVDKIELKFPMDWLKCRNAFINSLLHNWLVSFAPARDWKLEDNTQLPDINVDLTFPVSLFQPMFEQPPHTLLVNDTFKLSMKTNNVPTVRLAWGSQFMITAIANPLNNNYNAIVTNVLNPTLQLQAELAQLYSTQSQIYNYYSWKQSQEFTIQAGQNTFDFQIVSGDAIPDYVIVSVVNPSKINSSFRFNDYQYNNVDAASTNGSWRDHFSFDNNQIPVSFGVFATTMYGIKTIIYMNESYPWLQDGNTKAVNYAYEYQKRQFFNGPHDIQDQGNFSEQWGYQNVFIIPTDPGYYQKEEGDLFKHTDRGVTSMQISGTIGKAPMYMQQNSVNAWQPLPYAVTLRCYLVYNTVLEITPAKNSSITVPPSFPFSAFARISNLQPNSSTPVGDISSN